MFYSKTSTYIGNTTKEKDILKKTSIYPFRYKNKSVFMPKCWSISVPNKKVFMGRVWHSQTLLRKLISQNREPGLKSPSASNSSCLKVCTLECRRWWLKYVGPCHSPGRLMPNPGLLPSTWASPGCYRHPGSDPVNGRPLSMCVYIGVCHSKKKVHFHSTNIS